MAATFVGDQTRERWMTDVRASSDLDLAEAPVSIVAPAPADVITTRATTRL